MSPKDKDRRDVRAGYRYFVETVRDQHKLLYPNRRLILHIFAPACANAWKSMTPEKREQYETLSRNDEEFRRNYLKPTAKRRPNKLPGQPKRAWSAFLYFIDEYRPIVKDKNPSWRVSEISKELGKLWDKCTEREKYEKLAAMDRKRYEKDMEQFRKGKHFSGVANRPKMLDSSSAYHQPGEDDEDEEGYDDPEEIEPSETDGSDGKENSNKLIVNAKDSSLVNHSIVDTELTSSEFVTTSNTTQNKNTNNSNINIW